MRIVVTGGGTAGHVDPALAVIKEIQKQESNVEILYIGSYFGIENKIVVQKNILFKKTLTGKFRRYFSIKNFFDPFLVILGTFQALFYLISFRPKVIFSKGGFVSLPTCLAGAILRIPIILHESDAEMGLANRIIAPFTRKIAIAFPPEVFGEKYRSKITQTGNPQVLSKKTSKTSALAQFGLKKSFKTILVAGGSQGAQKINEALKPNLVALLRKYQIIHLTGTANIKQFESFRRELPLLIRDRYQVFGYIENEDLVTAFMATDLAVIRGGAGLLFKAVEIGTPALVVPLSGHQEANAQYFNNQKAVITINNSDLDSKNLAENIEMILENDNVQKNLSQNITKLKNPNSAKILAKLILDI